MFVFTSWLVSHEVCIHIYNISLVGWMRSKLQTLYLELIKRRSNVQEKNMSYERALNVDQWKTFSENYKPMRVWLWLVYKFTENCQIYRLFSEFIQTQKRYPTSLDKIHILTWKLLVIIKLKFFLWTKLLKSLLLAKYLISVAAPLSHLLIMFYCKVQNF